MPYFLYMSCKYCLIYELKLKFSNGLFRHRIYILYVWVFFHILVYLVSISISTHFYVKPPTCRNANWHCLRQSWFLKQQFFYSPPSKVSKPCKHVNEYLCVCTCMSAYEKLCACEKLRNKGVRKQNHIYLNFDIGYARNRETAFMRISTSIQKKIYIFIWVCL